MNVLSRFLLPPTYLTMPALGVDISDSSMKYVMFKPSLIPGVGRELHEWGKIDIPADTISRGAVTNQENLVAALKELKATTNCEHVRVALAEERAYLFETQVKRTMPNDEIRGFLEFKLEENVPIPSKDVYFDYDILPTKDHNKPVTVAVTAYARETIEAYYEACRAAELIPVSFELEAQSVVRSIVPKNAEEAIMIVDFGQTRTGIGIVYQGTLMYTSTVDIGGNHLSAMLRKAVGEKSEDEITKIKNTIGLTAEKKSTTVRDALVSTISVLKDELATRMGYWHVRSGGEKDRRIEKILLCGGSANLKGLSEYFSETLSVPVERANVWHNAFSLEAHTPPIDQAHSYTYATAIGLALKNPK